jgi:regulator of replication initiation timing
MKTNLSQVEATKAEPWSASIDWLLGKPEEREKSIVLGDSVGLTEEDIEKKVRRVKGSVQVERLITTMPFGVSEPSVVLYLMEENASLRREIEQIKQKLSELEERMPEEKVIVLREISREEAKEEIRQLFSSGRTLYYSDIAEELRLDLELVVAICHELQESGELRIDESVLRTW